MHVVIIGAGQVGSSIAGSLAESHEVVVVDIDAERVDSLQYEADVLTVEGDGTELADLEAVDIERADLLIASTDDDETNIVACGTAKTVGDPFTIARVKSDKYFETWRRSEGALGVDFMVGTNLLTAESIVRVIGLPAARDVESFADGQVQMAEFTIHEGSPVAGQTVEEADRFEALTFAAVLREDEIEIPRGDTTLTHGDAVVVIGSPESVRSFAIEVATSVEQARDVLVVGGSDIGYHTAELLGRRGLSPRLIERDPERARWLAEHLPGTTVLENDATDREFLERENIGMVDVVVTALDSDQANLLAALLAKGMGVERTVAVVEEGEYIDLFEAVGVDVAINPREVTAEEITQFTREYQAEKVAMIDADRAEVIQLEVDGESVLAGRTIQEAAADLPAGVVIGAITRHGQFVIPRGGTIVQPGDHVVVFAEETAIEEATELL